MTKDFSNKHPSSPSVSKEMKKNQENQNKNKNNNNNQKNNNKSNVNSKSSLQKKKKEATTTKRAESSILMKLPILFVLICPVLLYVIWFYNSNPGLMSTAWTQFQESSSSSFSLKDRIFTLFHTLVPMPTLLSLKMVSIFFAVETSLLLLVPSSLTKGPISPEGFVPVYRDNGVACYLLSVGLFVGCSLGLGLFSPTIIYDEFGPLISLLCSSATLLCLFLYFKGIYFPSSKDYRITGYFVQDFFFGIELYPTIFGIPLKQLVNCRLGMMGWTIVCVSFLFKQMELQQSSLPSTSMAISVFLQCVYIFKFYYWESGYFTSIDIMHDRFGFMICWGCLCWITVFYTSTCLWFVHHPIQNSPLQCLLIVAIGLASIWVNYDSDRQRQEFRRTEGKATVWGKKPEYIVATYVTGDGKEHRSLLLCSGWWGLARHFNYIPELLLALCWALPAGTTHLFPYSYFIFLTILLVDRSHRDDARCAAKYGKDWVKYCQKVPYKMIPFIY